jgi:hypothetical protein
VKRWLMLVVFVGSIGLLTAYGDDPIKTEDNGKNPPPPLTDVEKTKLVDSVIGRPNERLALWSETAPVGTCPTCRTFKQLWHSELRLWDNSAPVGSAVMPKLSATVIECLSCTVARVTSCTR